MHLIETLEYLLPVRFIDTDAKILYTYRGIFLVCCDMHNHPVGMRRIFDSIGQQIDEYLPNTIVISKYLYARHTFDRKLMSVCCGLKSSDRLLNNRIEIEKRVVEGEFSYLHSGNVEHIVDEVYKFVELPIHDGEIVQRLPISCFFGVVL